MTHLDRLKAWLRASEVAAFIVPSTDDYLSEFPPPSERRLLWATGFGGSTGRAIVGRHRAALILDSRYAAQGLRDTQGSGVEVLQPSEAAAWLAQALAPGDLVAADASTLSHREVVDLTSTLDGLSLRFADISNPIDLLWAADRAPVQARTTVDYGSLHTGVSAEEKLTALRAHLRSAGAALHLAADPEDVSWLLNVRSEARDPEPVQGWHVTPSVRSRLIVPVEGPALWFAETDSWDCDLERRWNGVLEVRAPADLGATLDSLTPDAVLSADLGRTPHRFVAHFAETGRLRHDDWPARRRWIKSAAEVAGAREGHVRDGLAVIRFAAWLKGEADLQAVTELGAAERLEALRSEAPSYRGKSMPYMSASGPNGSMAHYVPSPLTDRPLAGHPVYWMDSGGQYPGCSTDNTLCLALGRPEPRHVLAHTLVLKGFIALARARFPTGTYSSQLDTLTRRFLWAEGMDYGHGAGHGVGSYLNIHEGPLLTKNARHPLVDLVEEGMIVSNEPAFYQEGDFGIRIESHLCAVASDVRGFLEFETLSTLPIDPELVDFGRLSAAEKQWLADYHARLIETYAEALDPPARAWLAGVARRYAAFGSL